MIENDLQYELTKAAAERFECALRRLGRQSPALDDVHPLLRKAQEDSIRSELEILWSQLRAYELGQAGAGVSGSSIPRTE